MASSLRSNSKLLLLPLLVLLGLLAACGGDSAAEPPIADTADELTLPAGRNPDGTFYLGETDAPVTLTDYSDFL